MTAPAEFSVPDELLRTSNARPRAPRRLAPNSVDASTRALGLLAAAWVMLGRAGPLAFAVSGVVAIAASAVVVRAVIGATPLPLRRKAVAGFAGGVVAGAAGGLVATSAIDEAQGPGFVIAGSFAIGAIGTVLLVVAHIAVRTRQTEVPVAHVTTDAALEVRGLDFAYGTQQVLFDVSLTVAEGEIAALLG
ncbi:MAG: hypothetical protein QOC92_2659, partial [Acidimicrobiaceae bacterium]